MFISFRSPLKLLAPADGRLFLILLVFFDKSFQLFSMDDPGDWAHFIGDGYALQVVVFMLKGPCVEAFGLFGELFSVEAGCGDGGLFVSSHLRINAWY